MSDKLKSTRAKIDKRESIGIDIRKLELMVMSPPRSTLIEGQWR